MRTNPLDVKHAAVLAKALQASGIDAMARLNCDRLLRLLRGVNPNTPLSAADRRKLLSAFTQISVEGSPIAINAGPTAIRTRKGAASG
ncbi:MAG: hypothetical protein ACKVON_03095 [Beijerinckiaceae bacterium]